MYIQINRSVVWHLIATHCIRQETEEVREKVKKKIHTHTSTVFDSNRFPPIGKLCFGFETKTNNKTLD